MEIMIKINPQCKVLPKFTTRARRKDDDESIINVNQIPEECDYMYEQYGEKYAFSSQMLMQCLQEGRIPVLVVNDAETIEKLQKKLGVSMKSYFIHREKPSREKLIEIYNKTRGEADPEVIERRYQVAQEIYSMYTNKIALFDNIILNTAEGFDEVTNIVRQLFTSFSTQRRLSSLESNKIFVIAGNSGSGKDILLRRANQVGCLQIPKHTNRKPNLEDGEEMIFNGDSRYHLESCKLQYENFGNKYGIDTLPIWRNLIMTNKHQVLVCSDIGILRRLKAEFNESIVSIYVHSDMNVQEYVKMEQQKGSNMDYIRSRQNKYDEAHKNYAQNFTEYDKSFIYAESQKELMMQFAGFLGYFCEMVNEQKRGIAKG